MIAKFVLILALVALAGAAPAGRMRSLKSNGPASWSARGQQSKPKDHGKVAEESLTKNKNSFSASQSQDDSTSMVDQDQVGTFDGMDGQDQVGTFDGMDGPDQVGTFDEMDGQDQDQFDESEDDMVAVGRNVLVLRRLLRKEENHLRRLSRQSNDVESSSVDDDGIFGFESEDSSEGVTTPAPNDDGKGESADGQGADDDSEDKDYDSEDKDYDSEDEDYDSEDE